MCHSVCNNNWLLDLVDIAPPAIMSEVVHVGHRNASVVYMVERRCVMTAVCVNRSKGCAYLDYNTESMVVLCLTSTMGIYHAINAALNQTNY